MVKTSAVAFAILIVSGADVVFTGGDGKSSHSGVGTNIAVVSTGSTVPLSVTMIDSPGASDWGTTSAVAGVPRTPVGFIVVSSRQRSSGASDGGWVHEPETANSPGFQPPSLMAEMASGASPALVTKTGCTGLVVLRET